MSVLIGGDSSGGKSYLLMQLIKTLPPEMVVELQSVSNMGLAYMGRYALANRFLVLYELGGLGREGSEAIEQLKQGLTEGRIKRQIAESTSKGVGGRTVELEGPFGIWTTSTEMKIDKELSNRLFRVNIDESPEQTKRIAKARTKRNDNATDYGPVRGLHTYLAGQDNSVVVPFEDELTDLIDFRATRMRRDYDRIMDLLEAHAVLHQENRDRDAEGRIIATLEDYEAVHALIADIVGEASEATVSDTVRKTVEKVEELIAEEKEVTRNTLAEKLGIVPTSAGRRFAPATAAGYVKEDPENPNQKPKRYVLGDVRVPDEASVIPNPELLRSCVSASSARGEGTNNKDRASEDLSNARSDASVRAPSDYSVVADARIALTNGHYDDEPHDENSVVEVSPNRTHVRTICDDKPQTDEEFSIARASVRGSCADDLTIATELAADGMYSPEEIMVGLTRFREPIRVKRSSSVKGVEDGQDRQALLA